MNNPSPFIPQGSLVEQKNKGRARVKIAVFFVLAVHGVGLMALLMQGCRKDDKDAAADGMTNNAVDTSSNFAPTNTLADTNPAPVPQTNLTPIIVQDAVAPAAPTEYVIASGDTYSSIGAKLKVTVAAITAANPGVDPTKLQIGQKIKIPAPTPVSPGATTTKNGTVSSVGPNGEAIYTVKNGDTLTIIASHNHTTVKALRSANNLTTDAIKVGQKLRIPGKAEAAPGSSTPPGGGAR